MGLTFLGGFFLWTSPTSNIMIRVLSGIPGQNGLFRCEISSKKELEKCIRRTSSSKKGKKEIKKKKEKGKRSKEMHLIIPLHILVEETKFMYAYRHMIATYIRNYNSVQRFDSGHRFWSHEGKAAKYFVWLKISHKNQSTLRFSNIAAHYQKNQTATTTSLYLVQTSQTAWKNSFKK